MWHTAVLEGEELIGIRILRLDAVSDDGGSQLQSVSISGPPFIPLGQDDSHTADAEVTQRKVAFKRRAARGEHPMWSSSSCAQCLSPSARISIECSFMTLYLKPPSASADALANPSTRPGAHSQAAANQLIESRQCRSSVLIEPAERVATAW